MKPFYKFSIVFLLLNIVLTLFAEDNKIQRNLIKRSRYVEDDLKLDIKHRDGSGIGYNKGYTSLNLFYIPKIEKITPFIDFRLHVFNDGRVASNIGIGNRGLICSKYLLGVNAFYDYRSKKQLNYYQYGAGLEFLTKTFEFYANGYIPFGKKRLDDERVFDHFEGRELIVSQNRTSALAHLDFLARYRMYKKCDSQITPGIGGYYLFKRSNSARRLGSAAGIKGQIHVQILRYLTFGFDLSYDKIFKMRYEGQVGLSFPLSIKKRKSTKCKTRLAHCFLQRSVQRDEIIPVENKSLQYPLINPITAEPYQFIFVNNDSGSNGTFEDPFPTITEGIDNSSAHDIVYVFPGSSKYIERAFLKDTLRLQGSANSFELQEVIVPALTTNMPLMDDPSLSGMVVLANNNIVNGFIIGDLVGPVGDGIRGTAIQNAIIQNCNLVHGIGAQGIEITGSGNITVTDCIANSNSAFGGIGIFITASGDAKFDVQRNTLPRTFAAPNALILNGSTFNVCTRFRNNSTLPNGTYGLSNMTVESPDGTQAGVEAINQGNSSFTNVTFTKDICH